MGAEVIKIERPGGDPARNIGPFFQDDPHPEKSLFFAYNNAGKKGITLDLETEDGQKIFKRLARNSDVVLETFPVGYLENLGIDYTALRELNTGLVMTSITPFGQTGPHKDFKASSEIIPFAMGGVMFRTGEENSPPLQMGNFLVGYGIGHYAAIGTLAAVHNRWFTNEGAHVDISMQDCVASWLEKNYSSYQYLSPPVIETRLGSQQYGLVPDRVYPCKDGYWFCAAHGRWNQIVSWLVDEDIDVSEFLDSKYAGPDSDQLLWEELPKVNKLFCELGMKHTRRELMLEGQKRGLPVTLCADAAEVYEDPHLNAREYFEEIEHPVLGTLKYPGAPCKMARSPWHIGSPAPLIGQHNEEVYGELGLSEQELSALKAAEII